MERPCHVFTIGDHVWKQVKDSMWSGILIGSFRKLDGHLCGVVETPQHQIFISDVASLKHVANISEFKRY